MIAKANIFLRDIAIKALREINPSEISDKSIDEAIFGLEKIKLDDGVVKASEIIFLICLVVCLFPKLLMAKKHLHN